MVTLFSSKTPSGLNKRSQTTRIFQGGSFPRCKYCSSKSGSESDFKLDWPLGDCLVSSVRSSPECDDNEPDPDLERLNCLRIFFGIVSRLNLSETKVPVHSWSCSWEKWENNGSDIIVVGNSRVLVGVPISGATSGIIWKRSLFSKAGYWFMANFTQ